MKLLAALISTLLLSSFALAEDAKPKTESKTPAPKEAKKSLYERLGGQPAIEAVVKDFATRTLADARVNKKFAKSNPDRVVKNLTDFVCKATGGPCKYTGFDMKKAHKNMGVTQGEWDAVVENLVATLDAAKVPEPEKKEILAALGPLAKQIIENKKSKDTGGELPAKFVPAPPLKTDAKTDAKTPAKADAAKPTDAKPADAAKTPATPAKPAADAAKTAAPATKK